MEVMALMSALDMQGEDFVHGLQALLASFQVALGPFFFLGVDPIFLLGFC